MSLFQIYSTFIFITIISCQKNAKERAELKPKATAAADTYIPKNSYGQSSLDSDAEFENPYGAILVRGGAFSKTANVSLVEVSGSSIRSTSGLGNGDETILSSFGFVAIDADTSEPIEPQSGIAVTGISQTAVPSDTVGIVVVKNPDSSSHTFYVNYSDLVITQHPITGYFLVDFGLVVSGNFSAALVSGLSSATLIASFQPKPTTGIVTLPNSLPTNAATSISLTDTDLRGGFLAGSLNISIPTLEDFKHYAVYWGSNATTKLSQTPITLAAKTGTTVSVTITDAEIPVGATHILVFTRNNNGEMTIGVSFSFVDLGVPENAAVSMNFVDTDIDGGQLGGDIVIIRAADESDITHYVLYWGSNSTTKQNGTPIITIAKTGSNLTHTLGANTVIPTSPAATHILAFTKNADGEMSSGQFRAIIDLGVPINPAVDVAFTDTDLDGSQLGGNVTITRALNESDLTHYVLYWGSNSTTKQNGTAIAEIAKTGSDVTHNFAANTSIPSGPTATHLLVFTKNAEGEMATGVSRAITDLGVPANPAAGIDFTDTDVDGGQIGGTVNIEKAGTETDITHYVLYWGSNSTTKQNGTPIANIAKTGADVSHNFAANTSIPTGPAATHLLVFTKNAVGEMGTGINFAIDDIGVPVNAAASVAFTDTDTTSGQIGGTVTITKAATETDLTHYVLYWGSNTTTKQNGTPVANIAKTGANVTHNFAADTAIPTSPTATHLLVFTKNADGEMATGVNVAITDDNGGGGCPGGMTSVGGFCWVKASANQSCSSKCTAIGATYNTATASYAGENGTLAQCKNVVDAIEGGNNTVEDDDYTPVCEERIGCTDQGGGLFVRCTTYSTNAGSEHAAASRYCACTPPTNHRIFVTSTTYAPDFGALTNADGYCSARATAASLGGTWKAILSNDSTNASARITISGPVVNMNTNTVANNATDFWDGTLETAIGYDESGNSRNVSVWTGTQFNGTKHPSDNCYNWGMADPTYFGAVGGSSQVDDQWATGAGGPAGCDVLLSIYCIDGQ